MFTVLLQILWDGGVTAAYGESVDAGNMSR